MVMDQFLRILGFDGAKCLDWECIRYYWQLGGVLIHCLTGSWVAVGDFLNP